MPPPHSDQAHAPTFYLTGRQPLRPFVLLLATALAAAALAFLVFAMSHAGRVRLGSGRFGGAPSSSSSPDDDKDDPNQIDTIVLGDPADAPVPGRHGDHVSPVHPTIVIVLPRSGSQTGLIPNTSAGKLLYAWLAAFNHSDPEALGTALPSAASSQAVAAQLTLRKQTGGFNLLSSKEVLPGVLVFRLLDQTPAATEVLGTLQMRPDSSPPAIATFSLRAVPASPPEAGKPPSVFPQK
jgi:hypothetical protein